ncbi:MAG: hypothetical protein JNJ59_14415, partial [Deltaproteobacteria bacterium]|nr:hypothetical protein [Deltaproteobacteria bacterium]
DTVRDLVELVATWHELARFAPSLLPRWFPSLVGRPEVADLLDALVPVEDLLTATRPEGAPEAAEPDPATRDPVEPEPLPTQDPAGDATAGAALLESSRKQLDKGRDVAAAVLAFRARRAAPERAAKAETEALASLGRRLDRVGASRHGDGTHHSHDSGEWAQALAPLMPRARWGMARIEARLLHDLEKACLDAERESWDIDLGRWLRGFGRAPLRRREVVHTEVSIVRSLQRALHRVALCRIDETERRRLTRILGHLAHTIEDGFRERTGALIAQAMATSGLVPKNIPERVAHDKLIAELLDTLLSRGFIGLPDLRDLVAKNQLKLADLSGPGEWFSGDPLLVLDRECQRLLDGAYRRGEIYRRGLQRLSSLLFANRLGRFLVRFLILPVGGAYLLVQGLEHLVGPLIRLFDPITPHDAFLAVGTHLVQHELRSVVHLPIDHHHYYFWSLTSFIATSIGLFLILHVAEARTIAMTIVRWLGRGLRFVFAELPGKVRAWPPVDRLIATRPFQFFWHRIFRPLRYALLPTILAVVLTGLPILWLAVGLPLTLAFSFFLASRRGARFSEALSDGLTSTWFYLAHELVPGVIAAVMSFFKRMMELAEIALYTVDQWLRFRRGDSPFGLALKSLFGVVWGVFAYVVRFMVNLVVEPQVNPIKHFPVVTVSHKLTIPTTLLIAHELHPLVGATAANIIGGLAQFIIPGVCGFLVWEFKENWRLYAANRHAELRPVLVGSHGETMTRLLRLGFHSGTLPRVFRKLRAAEKKGKAVDIRKHTEELHHIEEAVERFVERELEPLLSYSGRFPEAHAIDVLEVRLTPQRIALDIGCAPLGAPMTLTFDERAGLLVAGVLTMGFSATLDHERRAALDEALQGLYRLAGVDLVREDIEAHLPGAPGEATYHITARGMSVFLAGFRTEIFYRLKSRAAVLEPVVTGEGALSAKPIPSASIRLKERPRTWLGWVSSWGEPKAVDHSSPPPGESSPAEVARASS